MTLREQAIAFIEQYPTYEYIIANREASNKLINLYYAMTGEVIDCGGCHDKGIIAYKGIENFIRKDSNQDHFINRNKIVMQFTLHKKAQVYSNTHGRFISEQNITDEIAVSLLAERYTNIEYFSGYPENYQELVDAYLANLPEPSAEQVQEQVQEEENPEPTAEEKAEEEKEVEQVAPAPASQQNFKKNKHGKR
jgi:hypothetical protein